MRRRELLLLASAMTAARPLRAQPVIGFLSSVSAESTAFRVTAFRQGLSETGYVEGQNLAIEYRWAEGRYDRLPRSVPETPTRRWRERDSNSRSLSRTTRSLSRLQRRGRCRLAPRRRPLRWHSLRWRGECPRAHP